MRTLCTLVLISGSLLAAPAQVAPPTLETYYWVYNGTDCSKRASKALLAAGFEAKKGTYPEMDHVGAKGEYKGVITCLNNKNNAALAAKDAAFQFVEEPGQTLNLVIFLVAGPVYKETNQLAEALKRNFEKAEDKK